MLASVSCNSLMVPFRPSSGAMRAGSARPKKGMGLPAGLDYAALLAQGERRFGDVARMELVRHLFRRPLEIWLLLDRALFLEEQGYRVEVGTFCPKPMTPRNLLIRAVRAGGI